MRSEEELVRLPGVLVRRVRLSLERQRQHRVTEAMVWAEIARRLRVGFAVDDLLAERERE